MRRTTAFTATAATMETAQGEVVLEEVGADAEIDDLMAVVSVSQRYRNPGVNHVEAVYTFPLPLGAVLLQFEVQLGDRRLAGTVIAKSAAEERYEDAIAEGDAAVRLEQSQPGLYTANVGNLGPGETATVRFRFGLLLRWNGETVRLMMPTTIAPRYGSPTGAGGLAPHHAPEFTFDAERSFRLQVAVRGVLQGARWSSPSHDLAVTPQPDRTVVEIARPAAMDRDVVLEAVAVPAGNARAAAGGKALLARDGGDWVVLASFRPELAGLSEAPRRNLKLVVDCSGSMSGDSIAQVRIAGERILDSLRPGDLFDIIAFGNTQFALFARETVATPENIADARRFVRRLDANMGGTEIGAALRVAYELVGERGTTGEPGMDRDLLLITDGEVWDTKRPVAEARRSGHRIFTVGVGSAVAEAFVRELAAATGGACELVAPREDMAERIHRHFQRILAPPARAARVVWPAAAQWTLPNPLPPPYPGDTMHLFGSFAERPCGPVALELELADGRTITQRMEVSPEPAAAGAVAEERPGAARSDLARLAAAQRLPSIKAKGAATDLAVRYQLLSKWTDYLVVHVRAEGDKADDLPALVKVPQVQAAGWHGTGTVHFSLSWSKIRRLERAAAFRRLERPAAFAAEDGAAAMPPAVPATDPAASEEGITYHNWVKLGSSLGSPLPTASAPPAATTPDEFVDALEERPLPAAPALDDLLARGLPDEIARSLRDLVDDGEDDGAVTVIFLYLVCRSLAGTDLDPQQRRSILAAYRKLAPEAATVRAVRRVWKKWDTVGDAVSYRASGGSGSQSATR